jgi:hypothetical protein
MIFEKDFKLFFTFASFHKIAPALQTLNLTSVSQSRENICFIQPQYFCTDRPLPVLPGRAGEKGKESKNTSKWHSKLSPGGSRPMCSTEILANQLTLFVHVKIASFNRSLSSVVSTITCAAKIKANEKKKLYCIQSILSNYVHLNPLPYLLHIVPIPCEQLVFWTNHRRHVNLAREINLFRK